MMISGVVDIVSCFTIHLRARLNMNSTNETTVMVRLSSSQLENVDWVRVEVVANEIFQGNNTGMLGIEGTRLGFGLVATGVG